MSVFLDDNDTLRSGWRVAVYVAVFVVILFANGALLALVFADAAIAGSEAGFLALNAFSLAVPAVLSLVFMAHAVDHAPLVLFGAAFHERWFRDFGAGIAVAAIMLGVYFGGAAAAGPVDMRLVEEVADPGYASRVAVIVLVLGVSAANEELLFRGYLLQVLMLGLGRWPAMIAVSALFGAIHHLNPNATGLGTVNTFLAGVLLALAYNRTRSLWLPFGIHIGWNLAIGPICGFAVSGIMISSVWRSEAIGPAWITGGAYGPEGGVLGTAVMVTAIVLVTAMPGMGVSPTVRAALERHAGKVPGP